jgi:undecaprenyl-diphosphatase
LDILKAILLGIIQGATEFLPISSSGHLLLVPSLLELDEPDLNVIAIAHLGTLLAVVTYFWTDLWQILLSVLDGLRRRQPLATENSRLGWYILVGTIPAALAGLLLEDFFDQVFGQPIVAAFMLLGTAGLLISGERRYSGDKPLAQMGWLDAIIIGLSQMLALMPGISRSGSTITAGLWRGLERPAAARFSFLLGVPAIAGAGLLAVVELIQSPYLAGQVPALLATFLSAALVGYACIHFLLSWLRQRSLYLFAAYCAAFGLFYLLMTWLQ